MSSGLVDSAFFQHIWEQYEEAKDEDSAPHEGNHDLYFRVLEKIQALKKQFCSEDMATAELGVNGGGDDEVWVDVDLDQVEAELAKKGVVEAFGAMVEACLEKLVGAGESVEGRETRRWIVSKCATRALSSGLSSARRARRPPSTAWRYPFTGTGRSFTAVRAEHSPHDQRMCGARQRAVRLLHGVLQRRAVRAGAEPPLRRRDASVQLLVHGGLELREAERGEVWV